LRTLGGVFDDLNNCAFSVGEKMLIKNNNNSKNKLLFFNFFFNKFIIDVIKFFYIYSYYDYYFYYSNNLLDTIINRLEFKNEIFLEFIKNLKNTLKLPKEFLEFPPFFNNEFDLNSVIYYNFELPSYFKFFDFLQAICIVFDKKKIYEKNNKKNFIDIIIDNISIDNPNEYSCSVSKSISLGGNLQPKKKLLTSSDSESGSNSDTKSGSNSDSSSNSDSDSDSRSGSNSDSKSGSESYNSSSSSDTDSDNNLNNKSHFRTKKENVKNSVQKKISDNGYSKDLQSNLDSEIINGLSKEEIHQINKPNSYIEFNCNEQITDFALNTEC